MFRATEGKKFSCAKFIILCMVNWITVCTVNIYTIILYTTCPTLQCLFFLTIKQYKKKTKKECLQKCYWIFYPSVHSLSSDNAMEIVRKRKVRIKTNLKASYGAPFLGKSLGAPEKYPLFPPPLRGLLMSTGLCTMWTLRLYLLYCLDHMRVK